MTDNQTGFKCISCEKIFTNEEPTTLNVDDWADLYTDYGPICEDCADAIRRGGFGSVTHW